MRRHPAWVLGAAAVAVALAGCGDNRACVGDRCALAAIDAGCDGDGCGPRCGDGTQNIGEGCDDGNAVDTDACTAACQRARCGDGSVEAGVEECDDANTVETDGCTTACRAARCGDGFVQAGEECDDGNVIGGDDCTNACTVGRCGDMVQYAGREQCDDGNASNEDFCLNTCRVNSCGDGFLFVGVEDCDDGNLVHDDGCSNNCHPARCGDNILHPGEACDDGNNVDGDGCEHDCTASFCGNRIIAGMEQCDDGNPTNGDGCDAACAVEPGFTCAMVPSVCVTTCGDGVIAGAEACDQGAGNVAPGDGCSPTCALEAGFACGGAPSVCAPTCGDGAIDANERCDDANLVDGDGCSPSCRFSIGCAPGEVQLIGASAAAIPLVDLLAASSDLSIEANANANVSKVVVYLRGITHPRAADLDLALAGPRQITRELSTDNGGDGDDYRRTFFDDGAAVAITAGAAPFTGRFRPEQALGAGGFRGQRAGGIWRLAILDDSAGETGTFEAWTLIVCAGTTVPRCGNAVVDAGEACDDGNDDPADACTNTCTVGP